jgi:hypothetical protein
MYQYLDQSVYKRVSQPLEHDINHCLKTQNPGLIGLILIKLGNMKGVDPEYVQGIANYVLWPAIPALTKAIIALDSTPSLSSGPLSSYNSIVALCFKSFIWVTQATIDQVGVMIANLCDTTLLNNVYVKLRLNKQAQIC